MTYRYLQDFMFLDVADGLEYGSEDEEWYSPIGIPEIVTVYVDRRSRYASLMLKREIKAYLKSFKSTTELENAFPYDFEIPITYEYFGCDTRGFLENICQLLDENLKRTRWRLLKKLFKLR